MTHGIALSVPKVLYRQPLEPVQPIVDVVHGPIAVGWLTSDGALDGWNESGGCT